jgi:CPA2 family monovalent cation:H+ antiporter-2
MHIPLLSDLVIIFGLSVVVIYICKQANLPVLVGLLLTGMLVGPQGLGLIHAIHEVEVMAEIGVILLLFSIGIEFSLKKLWQIRVLVLVGGLLQVGVTLATAAFVAHHVLGWSVSEAIFLGMLLSLSSTAIVLKLYQERGEMETMQGRLALGILIFQDMVAVLMILFVPVLGGAELEADAASIGLLLLIGLGIPAGVWIMSQYVLPQVLHRVVATRSPELFLLSIVSICFTVAWGTSELGISLALGAFLAGLIISESEYSHEAFEHVLPFRDIFTSIFFVSAGMLLDMGYLLANPLLVFVATSSILLLKFGVVVLTAVLLGLPLRVCLLAGFGLSQVGEFAIVVNAAGIREQLLEPDAQQLILTVIVLTMTLTSFLIAAAGRLAGWLLQLPWPERLRVGLYRSLSMQISEQAPTLQDHLVIVGYGLNGRNVARAAKKAQVPYVVLETNPDAVQQEQLRGEPVVYGDATQKAVLERVRVPHARTVVVVIAEATATRRIVGLVRELNPSAHLIVRTRYVREVDPLLELGANEVVPEEFETALEIFDRVLTQYLIPRAEIDEFVDQLRADGYGLLRQDPDKLPSAVGQPVRDHNLQITNVVLAEAAPWIGRSLQDIALRAHFGVNLVAVRRAGEMRLDLRAETTLCAADELFLIGEPEKVRRVAQVAQGQEGSAPPTQGAGR